MEQQRHPRGLYVLFATEMWERFSFYTMLAMLTLYMKDHNQGFGWDSRRATEVYSWYQAFVYATPLIGGLIADLGLGYRRAVSVGGLFFIAGHLLLAVPNNVNIFFTALVCLVVGNGFFKPCVSSMVGSLYPESSKQKDQAYLIFYMGINIGATLAPIIAEAVKAKYGFHTAFAVAAGGMVLSLAVFWGLGWLIQPVEAGKGEAATPREPAPIDAVPAAQRIFALLVIFAICIVFWMIFHQNGSTITYWANDNTAWEVSGTISNAINPICIVLFAPVLAWFWGFLRKYNLEPGTPMKIALGLLLTASSCLMLYVASVRAGYTKPVALVVTQEAEGTVLVQLSEDTRKTLGIDAPEVETSLPFSDEGKKILATRATVVGGGEFLSAPEMTSRKMRLCRLESIEPGKLAVVGVPRVSPLWLIAAILIISIGELMLSPMGLSLVSKVAPAQVRGLMMGGWFLATAIGNKWTSIGGNWDVWSHAEFFGILGWMALGTFVVLLALLRLLARAMPGV